MQFFVTLSQSPPQAFVLWGEHSLLFEGEAAAKVSLWVEDLTTKVEALRTEVQPQFFFHDNKD